MLAYSPYDNLPPAGSRPDLLVTGARPRPAGDGARAGQVGGRAARQRPGVVAALPVPRASSGAGAHVGPSGRFGHLGYEAEVARLDPRPARGRRMTDLHDEVLRVARDLIRMDTSNAPARLLGRRPGNETAAAAYLRDYLTAAGVDCELVAREEHRANLVARLPGTGDAPSLAFVGHTDVVPVDPRDWTHPPFEGVVDDDGYLHGRGAVDMKNEVAARAVALAELARTGFRPRGDLWFLAVADEEDGMADVGMRWLLEARPDIRPDVAINEGGGELLALADGRTWRPSASARRAPCRSGSTAVGEAGHASMPNVGDNAVPLLGELLRRVGRGMPDPGSVALAGGDRCRALGVDDVEAARALHPTLAELLPAMTGTTMAPTLLEGSTKRNVMPSRASVELDCRILPGTTRGRRRGVGAGPARERHHLRARAGRRS